MSSKKNTSFLEALLLVLSSIAILMAIKSLFDNDDSKIVSKEGRDYLSDKDKMKALQKRFEEVDNDPDQRGDIIVV